MNYKTPSIIVLLLLIISGLVVDTNAQTKGDSLIVFVGRLVSIEKIPQKMFREEIRDGDTIRYALPIIFDSKFKSKFEVVKLINGYYSQDTIEFISYDHYGKPGYTNFEYSLLFVSVYNDQLVQQKYTYFPVYKTKNGRWASNYSFLDYSHPFKENFTIQPEKLKFKEQLSFDIKNMTDEQVNERYPIEYYEHKNGKAIATHGNYIEELFELKKQGFLKARGLFE